VAQVPRIEPFPFGEAYGKLGAATSELIKSPVESYMRGQELGRKARAEEVAVKTEEFKLEALEEASRNAEKNKEALKEYKDMIGRVLLGDKGYFAISKGKKVPGKERGTVEVGGVMKEDIPYEEALLTTKRILDAESKAEVDEILRNIGQYVSSRRNLKKAYPNTVKRLDKYKDDSMVMITDKQGNRVIDYGNRYKKRADNVWLQETVRDYMAQNPTNPNENEALQYVIKQDYGKELAQDKNVRETIKDMFLGELDRYKATTARIGAQTRQEKTKEETGIEAVNNAMLIRTENELNKNLNNINAIANFDKSLLTNTGQFLKSKEYNALSDANKEKALKLVQQHQKLNMRKNMTSAGLKIGIKMSEIKADNLIKDILDADGPSSPEAKQFAIELGLAEPETKKKAAIELGLEEAPLESETPTRGKAKITGDGTQGNPFIGITTQEEADNLRSDQYFVNPEDGKVYQKQ